MHIDGRCHCGRLRYDAEVDPENVLICHCTDCQSLSGSAFRTVVLANEGTFRFVAGEPLRRVHECVFGVLALESEPVDPRL